MEKAGMRDGCFDLSNCLFCLLSGRKNIKFNFIYMKGNDYETLDNKQKN